MLVLRLRRGVCMKAYMYERYPQAIVLSDTSNRCSPQRHRAFEKMALWLFKTLSSLRVQYMVIVQNSTADSAAPDQYMPDMR